MSPSSQLDAVVKLRHKLEVKKPQVKDVLRSELGLSYRKVRRIPPNGNTDRCLVLR